LIESSGASREKIETFERSYENVMQNEVRSEDEAEDVKFVATNITNHRKFEIKTADVVVKVSPEQSHLVETRVIDGIPYLMIQINEHVELNGIAVRPDVSKNE